MTDRDEPMDVTGEEPIDDVNPGDDRGVDGGEPDEEELVEEEVERIAARASGPGRKPPGPLRRLYRGETSFPFVARRRVWLSISALIILAGVVSLGVRGLNLGITFKGGEAWTVKAPGVTQVEASNAVAGVGLSQSTVELLGTGSNQVVRVTADLNALGGAARQAETAKVVHALAKLAKVTGNQVSVTTVGPTWGGQVTQRALIALVVFLVLVAVYISIRFEPKMALAAFVALIHDLLVTAGVYSLAGFQVTPDTVIAVLTILGYSLYDTVVVFDRVRDNTRGLGATGRMTYSEMVDLSMNQTLARSINTSLVAILPVLSVLLIGAELLGATTLLTYGLALFVGLLSGAYSSIFIASPILAWLKEREPRYVAIRQRIESKGERLGLLTPKAAAALTAVAAGGAAARAARQAPKAGTLRPGQSRAGSAPRSPRAGGTAAAARRATATLDPGADGDGAPAGDGVPAGGSANGGTARRSTVSGGGATRTSGPPRQRPPQRSRKGGKGKRRR